MAILSLVTYISATWQTFHTSQLLCSLRKCGWAQNMRYLCT